MTIMRMYVGNLDLSTTDSDLAGAFKPYGSVASAMVMKNNHTGETHGYGFVEMEDPEEAQRALSRLYGSDLRGRSLVVIKAQRTEQP
jgi:RNA recognition motif-containing protein